MAVHPGRAVRYLAPLVALALVSGACGTSGGASPAARGSPHGGDVNVLYAGSLVAVMERGIGPAFGKATGYTFQGFSAGSSELANEITGKIRPADVFVSASPAVNEQVLGRGWESWYATFATAPLVIAYNPNSSFARRLTSQSWWKVLAEPGIRVGRTDPKLDPKGKLTVAALAQAGRVYRDPGLERRILAHSQVFPETELIGRLEAGQLDAGFFYSNEAKEQALPTVSLGRIHEAAVYTVTVPGQAPDPGGADAFVRFLLGASGRALLTRYGLQVLSPAVAGDVSSVPAPLRPALGLSR